MKNIDFEVYFRFFCTLKCLGELVIVKKCVSYEEKLLTLSRHYVNMCVMYDVLNIIHKYMRNIDKQPIKTITNYHIHRKKLKTGIKCSNLVLRHDVPQFGFVCSL